MPEGSAAGGRAIVCSEVGVGARIYLVQFIK